MTLFRTLLTTMFVKMTMFIEDIVCYNVSDNVDDNVVKRPHCL